MRSILVIFLLVLLAGCSSAPSQDAIQTAIVQTQAAAPTITPIPIKDIDLSKIIFTEGDLPPGFSPSQIMPNLNDIVKEVPPPVNFYSQKMENNGQIGGLATVLLYENTDDAEDAYWAIINNMISSNPSDAGIGDKSLATQGVLFINTVDVALLRCKAAAHVQFQGMMDKGSAIAYMAQLDRRLKQIVCDNN